MRSFSIAVALGASLLVGCAALRVSRPTPPLLADASAATSAREPGASEADLSRHELPSRRGLPTTARAR